MLKLLKVERSVCRMQMMMMMMMMTACQQQYDQRHQQLMVSLDLRCTQWSKDIHQIAFNLVVT
jgi:hypothetical protein